MIREQDICSIKKISIIGLAILAAAAILSYFIFPFDAFLAVIASSSLAFLIFILTLFFFRWLRMRNPARLLQFIFASFFAKIVFLGLAFYLTYRFGLFDMLAFALSFLIFFTLFLNMEVFFIYKRISFK